MKNGNTEAANESADAIRAGFGKLMHESQSVLGYTLSTKARDAVLELMIATYRSGEHAAENRSSAADTERVADIRRWADTWLGGYVRKPGWVKEFIEILDRPRTDDERKHCEPKA